MRYIVYIISRHIDSFQYCSSQVTRSKKWADLGRLLGYGGIPGLATQMKNSYARVILPYEHFCEHVRNSPNMSPSKPHDPTLKTHMNIQSAGKSVRSSIGAGDDSPPSSPLTATSSPLSEPPDESDKNDSTRPRRSARQTSHEQSTRKYLDITTYDLLTSMRAAQLHASLLALQKPSRPLSMELTRKIDGHLLRCVPTPARCLER